MAVELKTAGRTREVNGCIYLERWIQIDAGSSQIYADLNTLDALCDSSTSGSCWYGAPSPGEYDAGDSNAAWFGQAIRVPFKRLQPSGQWAALKEAALAFVEAAFPGELVYELNRRFERPPVGDVTNPAKYIQWMIEYD